MLKLTRPSFGGHHEEVLVNGTRYGLPPGSRIKKVRRGARELAYVVTYDGELAAFVKDGQVEIPASLQPIIRSAHFPELASESEQP